MEFCTTFSYILASGAKLAVRSEFRVEVTNAWSFASTQPMQSSVMLEQRGD